MAHYLLWIRLMTTSEAMLAEWMRRVALGEPSLVVAIKLLEIGAPRVDSWWDP
jgi:hypothetical protein